jgi:hypothetical protein
MRAFAAQNLLPTEGYDIQFVPRQVHRKGGAGGVANRQTGTIRRDRITTRQADAAGGAVPCEHHVLVEIDLRHIDDLAIGGLAHDCVQLQLLDHIGDPAFAKAFPSQHFNRTGPQQRPHCHFDGPGIRPRHNADAIVGRHVQDGTGQVDRFFQLGLADGGAVRPPQRRIAQHIEGITGNLGAGARGKTRICRARSRGVQIRHGILPDKCPSVGKGVPPLRIQSGLVWHKPENHRKAPHRVANATRKSTIGNIHVHCHAADRPCPSDP